MPVLSLRKCLNILPGRNPVPRSLRYLLKEDDCRGDWPDPGAERIIDEGIGWLCRAQDGSSSADGGVARHYSLVSGWGPSYPETTGYIIPTILAHADRRDDKGMLQRGRQMLDWLVSIQFDNGAFQGGTIVETPIRPVTFNTGQILIGLAAGQARLGTYFEPMRRAADWLARTQDEDGCWRLYPSPFAEFMENSYYTHVAWGLLEAARLTQCQEHADAALANIRWAIGRQHENGWFDNCCLEDLRHPLTHTIGYALRGILEGYAFSGDETLLVAARKTAEGLLPALRPDGWLSGRFDANWQPFASWVCLTGSSQIAHCWLLLYQMTGETKFLTAGRLANSWVRRTVRLDGDAALRGGVRGSVPWDDYCRFELPNWAAKFTIDANALELTCAASGASRAEDAAELASAIR